MGLLAQAAKALSAFSGNKGRSAVRPTPQYVPAKAKPPPKKRPPPLLPKHRDPPLEEVEATLREKPRDKRSLILAARFRFREGNYRGSIDAACKSIEEGGPFDGARTAPDPGPRGLVGCHKKRAVRCW